MKYDEFAFFNQQLSTMLRDGLPLEGALRRLCEQMRAGSLRNELQALEADLGKGTPLADALKPRRLPGLYKQMIVIGVKSGDLPGALNLLADYFQRQSNLRSRLKGLMVYPLIVLFTAFFISCTLACLFAEFVWNNLEMLVGQNSIATIATTTWMTPVFLGLVFAAALTAVLFTPIHRILRWRFPAFREASLAQLSAAIGLMLKNGVPLDDALAMAQELESGTVAEREIAQWRQRLAAGHGKFSDLANDGIRASKAVIPPLFIWTVAQAGKDLTTGFQRAAELYHARAIYRIELLLYSALPVSVLALAGMIVTQVTPVFFVLSQFLRNISGD